MLRQLATVVIAAIAAVTAMSAQQTENLPAPIKIRVVDVINNPIPRACVTLKDATQKLRLA